MVKLLVDPTVATRVQYIIDFSATPRLPAAGTGTLGSDTLDDANVYWFDATGLWRTSINGGAAVQLAPIPGSSVTADSGTTGYVYFVDNNGNLLKIAK